MRRMYKYYQPNEKDIKDERGDCVVRAFTKLFDCNWVEAYDMLCAEGREIWAMANDKETYENLLKKNGYKYQGISNKKGTKRPTVNKFAKEHEKGRYLLNLANHVVAVVDGQYFDKWNSGEKCLYGYWYKFDTH